MEEKVKYLFRGFCTMSNIRLDWSKFSIGEMQKCISTMTSENKIREEILKSIEDNPFKKHIDVEGIVNEVVNEMIANTYVGINYENDFYLMDWVVLEYEIGRCEDGIGPIPTIWE